MKHRSYRIVSVLCILAILMALPVLAFAEEETSSAEEKGLEAIQETGDQKRIQLPKESSYLEEFRIRYVDFSDVMIPHHIDGKDVLIQMNGPSAPVESKPNLKGVQMPSAYQGAKVTVVAEQKNYSCILYRDCNNKLHAGWIWDIYLGDEYNGKSLTIGTENSSAAGSIPEVPMTWSQKGFLKSPQRYSVLKEPVKNCVGFTLEYQIVSEGTDKRNSILGPRTVYVYDGTQWIEAGSFEYPELGTVSVRVNLNEPIDVEAVGTIAECSQPNVFLFRQLATDFATTDGT